MGNYPRAKERAARDPRATMMMMAREERKISLLDTIIMATMILVRMTTTITTARDPRETMTMMARAREQRRTSLTTTMITNYPRAKERAERDPRAMMTMMARASQERDPRRATLLMIDTINLRSTITVSKNLVKT